MQRIFQCLLDFVSGIGYYSDKSSVKSRIQLEQPSSRAFLLKALGCEGAEGSYLVATCGDQLGTTLDPCRNICARTPVASRPYREPLTSR